MGGDLMRLKKVALFATLLAIAFMPSAALAGDVLTMDEVIETAMANNPELAAATSATEAAFARPAQAATPPDPNFMVQFSQVPIDTIDVGQGMITYMVQQQIPFPSKLVYGYKAEKRAAEAVRSTRTSTAQELVRQVKLVYLNIWRLQEEDAIERQTLGIYRHNKGVAEAAYASLESSVSDPVRAAVDLGDVEARLTFIEQEKLDAVARLSALIDEPLDPGTRVSKPKTLPRVGKLSTFLEMARVKRPEIDVSDKTVSSQKARVSLAKSQYAPDLTLRWGYDDRPNQQNAWTGRFMLSVPLWAISKQRFGVQESKAMLHRAESMREHVVLQTEAQTKSAYARLNAAKRRANIYTLNVVPRAKLLLASSQEAYRNGKGDFLSVVDSIRSLNHARVEKVRATHDAQKAYADLERAVGSYPTEEK